MHLSNDRHKASGGQDLGYHALSAKTLLIKKKLISYQHGLTMMREASALMQSIPNSERLSIGDRREARLVES